MTCKELAEAVKKQTPSKYEQIESQYGSGVVAAYIAWANQADDSETEVTIDGKIAAAVKFAKPVLIVNGLFFRRFCLGAPRGYLVKYARL